MKYPKVSIIILSWNRYDDICECINSVKKSDYPCFDIIVVDNGSKKNVVADIEKNHKNVILIKNSKNLGFTGGNNIGMRHAMSNGSDYVWLLNNDTIVDPNALSGLIEVAENNSHAGLLSPIIHYFSAPNRAQYYGSYFDWKNRRTKCIKSCDEVHWLNKQDVALWGTALLIKRNIIEKIGYLENSYFAYWEDTEYSLRSLRAGYSNLIVPVAKIYHKHHYCNEEGEKVLPAHYFYYMTRNEYWLWRTHTKGLMKLLFIRKYIANTLRRIGHCKEMCLKENVNACFDGLYDAFHNIRGERRHLKKPSSIIRTMLLKHPYLFADIVDLNFKNILLSLSIRKQSG